MNQHVVKEQVVGTDHDRPHGWAFFVQMVLECPSPQVALPSSLLSVGWLTAPSSRHLHTLLPLNQRASDLSLSLSVTTAEVCSE